LPCVAFHLCSYHICVIHSYVCMDLCKYVSNPPYIHTHIQYTMSSKIHNSPKSGGIQAKKHGIPRPNAHTSLARFHPDIPRWALPTRRKPREALSASRGRVIPSAAWQGVLLVAAWSCGCHPCNGCVQTDICTYTYIHAVYTRNSSRLHLHTDSLLYVRTYAHTYTRKFV
jgi:hypothetical protein